MSFSWDPPKISIMLGAKFRPFPGLGGRNLTWSKPAYIWPLLTPHCPGLRVFLLFPENIHVWPMLGSLNWLFPLLAMLLTSVFAQLTPVRHSEFLFLLLKRPSTATQPKWTSSHEHPMLLLSTQVSVLSFFLFLSPKLEYKPVVPTMQ